MIFTKTLLFSVKVFFFQINYLFTSPFKKFNSVKKNPLCKKIHFVKQTHSLKDEFYFQFSFATNEQV